ncbi:hypothetical protein D3C84_972730 [compost metagenome]
MHDHQEGQQARQYPSALQMPTTAPAKPEVHLRQPGEYACAVCASSTIVHATSVTPNPTTHNGLDR